MLSISNEPLHLVGDFLAEAGLDQLARARPARKPGTCPRHHLAERLVVVALDIVAGDRHRHVALAGATGLICTLRSKRFVSSPPSAVLSVGDGGVSRCLTTSLAC